MPDSLPHDATLDVMAAMFADSSDSALPVIYGLARRPPSMIQLLSIFIGVPAGAVVLAANQLAARNTAGW